MRKPSSIPSLVALALCAPFFLLPAPAGFGEDQPPASTPPSSGERPSGQRPSEPRPSGRRPSEPPLSELRLSFAPALSYRTDSGRLLAADSDGRAPFFRPFYRYEALPGALTIDWATRLGDFSTLLSLPVRRSYYAAGGGAWGTNVPFQNLLDLDTTIPFRGWVAWETPRFGARLARDRLAIGQGYWSSMIANAQAPHFDYLKAYYGFGGFQLSEHIIRLNPSLVSEEERTNQAADAFNNLEGAAYTERAKTVVVHALRWRPARWLELGLGEALIVGGRSLQLSDFNPMLVFHDFYGEDWGNVFGFANAAVTLGDTLRLYADAAVDDLTAPTEAGVSSAPPPAWGALVGLQARGALPSSRLSLLWVVEAAYVSPTFGQRTKPLQAPYSRILYLDNTVGGRRVWVDYPLGYYLGNDLLDGRTRLEAAWKGGALYAGYHELWKGEEEIGADPRDEGSGIHRGFLPRGVVEKTREISAGLSLGSPQSLEVSLEGALRFTENLDHAAGADRRDFDLTLRASRDLWFRSRR